MKFLFVSKKFLPRGKEKKEKKGSDFFFLKSRHTVSTPSTAGTHTGGVQ